MVRSYIDSNDGKSQLVALLVLKNRLSILVSLVPQSEGVTVTVVPCDDHMACGLGLFWDNILRLLEEMDSVLSHRMSRLSGILGNSEIPDRLQPRQLNNFQLLS